MKAHRVIVLVAAGLAALTAVNRAPATAQAPPETVGIRIVDAPTNRQDDPRARQYIVDHVKPGTTINRRVEVVNNTKERQLVQLYAAAGSITDGTFQFGDGRAANDLTTWTTVSPDSVNPPAGGKTLATVKIAVPANASAGEHYGVIWAELPAARPPGGGVGAVNRVGVRIYLSVGEGGEPPSDFAVTTLEAGRDADGNPVVTATVDNTGGRALDLSGELSLTNGPGGLSAGPFDAKLGTTLGIGEKEPVLVMLDRAIPAGPWDARIKLRSGTTEREATAKVTFPAAPASSSGAISTEEAASTDDAEAEEESSPLLLVLVVVVAGVGLFLLLLLLRRRRSEPPRHRKS